MSRKLLHPALAPHVHLAAATPHATRTINPPIEASPHLTGSLSPSMDSMGRTTLFRNSAAVREPVVAAMWSAAPTRACNAGQGVCMCACVSA